MNVKAFNDMQEKIASTYTYVADGSMKNAANNLFVNKGKVMKILQTILLILLFQMMEAGKNVVTDL